MKARQSRAFEELKDPTPRISQIAWICGFSDPNYFAGGFAKKSDNLTSMACRFIELILKIITQRCLLMDFALRPGDIVKL